MDTKGIKMLCTLGPASLTPQVIRRLTDRGVACFRINLSHTALDQLETYIQLIKANSAVPICIDTEGAQVRSGPMQPGIVLQDRHRLRLRPGRGLGNADEIFLWPESVVGHLQPGDIVAVDFDSVLLLVERAQPGEVSAVVLNGGAVGSNKAVNVYPPRPLPALSEKDIAAVSIAQRHGITDYALSFANTAHDVQALRKLAGNDAHIIAKIENQSGVHNLDAILDAADAILIDRGDLSREVPLENVPLLQKAIIRKANSKHRPVFVATNLLESMLTSRKPTRAELNDVTNTLLDGANGLVLAAETAIGKQPVLAIDILATLIERYKKSLDGYRITDLLKPNSVLLPPLHGREPGAFLSLSGPPPVSVRTWNQLPKLTIDIETAMDVEQIANGVYSPITGFMTEQELEAVLDRYHLPNGAVWTLPIVLQTTREQAANLAAGMTVALHAPKREQPVALLHLQDRFSPDLPRLAQRWFGTADRAHPGVARLLSRGDVFLGGRIEALPASGELPTPYKLTPAQARMIFSIKGWRQVVGFHTRNVPHSGHEFLMREALSRSNADGLFIHPVIGTKKPGDFTASAILGAYDLFIGEALPGALLGAFSTYSRYSGPREAVFTALCRKNFGCSHFVVGRDHTGVGSFYAPTAAHDLFESLPDLGITPVFFDRVYFCAACGHQVEACTHGEQHARHIAGTLVRETLRRGEDLPDWFVRPTLSRWLRAEIQAGRPVFVE
jgi:pyruvate kinase